MNNVSTGSKTLSMFLGMLGIVGLIGNIIYTIIQKQQFLGIWGSLFAAALPFYVAWYLGLPKWVYLVIMLLAIVSAGISPRYFN